MEMASSCPCSLPLRQFLGTWGATEGPWALGSLPVIRPAASCAASAPGHRGPPTPAPTGTEGAQTAGAPRLAPAQPP